MPVRATSLPTEDPIALRSRYREERQASARGYTPNDDWNEHHVIDKARFPQYSRPGRDNTVAGMLCSDSECTALIHPAWSRHAPEGNRWAV